MLDFGGKTLLQRQLDAYKKCGVKDISLIRGYKKEKINYKGIKYFENTDYKNNNILNSIFYAEKIINEGTANRSGCVIAKPACCTNHQGNLSRLEEITYHPPSMYK